MKFFGKRVKSDSAFEASILQQIDGLESTHQQDINDRYESIQEALLTRDYDRAVQLLQDLHADYDERQMKKREADALERIFNDFNERIEYKRAKQQTSLTKTFVKAAIMTAAPIALTMAASAVFPPAGFVAPLAFMAAGWISSGYKIHKENIQLENDIPRLSLPAALKTGLMDKVSRLKSSAIQLANPLNLVKQEKIRAEISGEQISNTRASLRAIKNNAGHIGLVAGSFIGLGLKMAGLGDGLVDAISEKFEELTISTPLAIETSPIEEQIDNDGNASLANEEQAGLTQTDTDADADVQEDSETAAQDESETDLEPSDQDKMATISAAGMPIVEGVDLDLQYQMANVLPNLELLSGQSQQYFTELYDRMDSENPLVQAQAFKDYADLTLNCLTDIEGLDNKALAYDLAQAAVDLGDGTNCQALNFLAYLELHGIGGNVDVDAATQHYLDALGSHESNEAYDKLVYIAQNNLVDLDSYPALSEILAIHEEEMAANAAQADIDTETIIPPPPEPLAYATAAADQTPSPSANDDILRTGESVRVETTAGDFNCTANQDMDIDDAAVTIGANKDNLENLSVFECRPAA